MQLLNLKIDRIIIHQIHQRDNDGNMVVPTQGHEYTVFDQNAMDTFKNRVRGALGEDSKAVQMRIVDQENNDLPCIINNIIDDDDEKFIESSYNLAQKLTRAQQSRSSIPGGILVIFTGTQGAHSKKFLGIIKAEIHSGYEKYENENGEITLKFVKELLLTPGTRLYKTAGFFEKNINTTSSTDLNDKWVVMVSDYQINKAGGKAAARYFYSAFLGCDYPESEAWLTKKFYEETKNFIGDMGLQISEESDLLNALNTYLKTDTASSISVSEFSSRYFDDRALQDSYTSHMGEHGLSGREFIKNIEFIRNKLKHRNIWFRNNIKITAPAERFEDLITMEAIEGDPDESGVPSEWTKVTIKDRVSEQE